MALSLGGRCRCEQLRYRLEAPPLFTHACHCLDCQRQTGSAFSMTSIVMLSDHSFTHGRPSARSVSPRSTEYRCPECGTVIYVASTRFPSTVILRPGTLDRTEIAAPQAHIWVRRKQSWLELPADVPQFLEQYERESVWPAASLARIRSESHAPR